MERRRGGRGGVGEVVGEEEENRAGGKRERKENEVVGKREKRVFRGL